MNTEELLQLVTDAMDDMKAEDIKVIDVRGVSSVTDIMVICTGTSSRHIKSIAGNVIEKAKHAGNPPIGAEGEDSNDWVLVDLGDVVAHVMTKQTRDFYQLERLWSMPPSDQEAANE